MGWRDTIGGAGEILNAANSTQSLLDQERYQQAARRLAMEQGIRANDQQAQAWSDQQAIRNVQVPDIPPVAGQPITAPGGPGENITEVVGKTPDIPARPDAVGKLRTQAHMAANNGNLKLYSDLMTTAHGLESEGLGEFARSLLRGEDPAAAAAKFSQTGNTRVDPTSVQWDPVKGILTGKRDTGQPFYIDARRTLQDMGMMPQNKLLELGPGSVAVDPITGEQKAVGGPKDRHMDPFGPEAIAAKKSLEDYKAQLASHGKDTAENKNISFLVSKGVPEERAIEIAFHINKDSKSEEERVLRWANVFKSDFNLDTPDKLLAKAQATAKSYAASGADRASRPLLGPRPSAGPGTGTYMPPDSPATPGADPPPTLAAPDGSAATFTGKFTPAGKPIYSNGNQQFVGE